MSSPPPKDAPLGTPILESPFSISLLNETSSVNSSSTSTPPGTPIPRCPSPTVATTKILDCEETNLAVAINAAALSRKGLGKISVSPLLAFLVVSLASLGGFFAGRRTASLLWAQKFNDPGLLHSPPSVLPPSSHVSSLQEQQRDRNMVGFQNSEILPMSRRSPPLRRPRVLLSGEQIESERRKRLAADAIHPVLLTVLPVPTSIAIAIDWVGKEEHEAGHNKLSGDLLSAISAYKQMERVTMILVNNGNDSSSSHQRSSPLGCPPSLVDILTSNERRDIFVECTYISNESGTASSDRESFFSSRHHDVAIVLASCDNDNNNKLGVGTKWEEDLYASTDSVAVKCVGKTYPLDHPAPAKGSSSNNFDKIEDFFVSTDSFVHVTDYDSPDGNRGIATNLAVAFRSVPNGMEQWRQLSGANLQVSMHNRWTSSALEDLEERFGFVDVASTMVRARYPSRQSAASFCNRYRHRIVDEDDDWEKICEVGLDPYIPNLPAENFYVAPSTVGEHVGRGIFTKVDLTETVYLMAEKSAHDVIFSFKGFAILEDMLKKFCLAAGSSNHPLLDSFHCIPEIYYNSYGFVDGFGLHSNGVYVNSGIMTFVNHGCNGTQNIESLDDNIHTEFTMLPDDYHPDPETFEIPGDFWDPLLYNPNRERYGDLERFNTFEGNGAHLEAHTEILDNYAAFSKTKYFLEEILRLKEQCMGAIGPHLAYEDKKKQQGLVKGKNEDNHRHAFDILAFDILASPFVLDTDAVILRWLASRRRALNHNATQRT